jgi:hypothetical protein
MKALKPLKPLAPRKKSPTYKVSGGQSTFIKGHTYNPDTRELSINFHNGKSFTYSDVPPHVSVGLRDAPSKGKYFHAKIRGNFTHKENNHGR